MISIFCSNCKETFGFEMNTRFVARNGQEELTIVCPKCKASQTKKGEKVENEIEFNQIGLDDLKER